MESWLGMLTTVGGGVTVSTGSVGWGVVVGSGAAGDDKGPEVDGVPCPAASVLSLTEWGRRVELTDRLGPIRSPAATPATRASARAGRPSGRKLFRSVCHRILCCLQVGTVTGSGEPQIRAP
ncbi:MAG: hypothetical protein ACYDD0_11670 [Candidatus Dormibacteria bacterium]